MRYIRAIAYIATYALWWFSVAIVGGMIYTGSTTPLRTASHAPTHTSTPNIDATQNARLDALEATRQMPTIVPTATMQPSSTPPPTATPRATVTPTLNNIFTTATTQAMTPTTPPTRNPIFATATALWLPTPTQEVFVASATPSALLYRVTSTTLYVLQMRGAVIVRQMRRGDVVEMTSNVRTEYGIPWRETVEGYWMDDRFLERVQ